MNYIIIDSCVWIDYFRNKINFKEISQLLIDNLALTNKIILSELIPSAMTNKEYDFIDYLSGIDIVPLDIDWDEIIGIQYQCIKTGINKLGLLGPVHTRKI
jgi:hypothetical protein